MLVAVNCIVRKLAHFSTVSVAAGCCQNLVKCSLAQLTLQHCFDKYKTLLMILLQCYLETDLILLHIQETDFFPMLMTALEIMLLFIIKVVETSFRMTWLETDCYFCG